LNYVWGHYYFLNGDDDKALGFINKCIDLYDAELDAILANAYLLKGQIHDKKHERMEAVMAYQQCIKRDNHAHAIILAKQYLDEPYQG
jgi:tetratricopeptide (TPR) repeat protein